MFGVSNDETNFQHELLLANTQVSRICNAFADRSPTNIKLSKFKLSKMVQPGWSLVLDYIPPLRMISSIANSFEK